MNVIENRSKATDGKQLKVYYGMHNREVEVLIKFQDYARGDE